MDTVDWTSVQSQFGAAPGDVSARTLLTPCGRHEPRGTGYR